MATSAPFKSGTKTEVFNKEDLIALRKALNDGVNGDGAYAEPPRQEHSSSDDWRNDIELLVKFLYDLRDIMSALAAKRLPPRDQERFTALIENLQPTIDEAVKQLRQIDGTDSPLFKLLDRFGLLGDAFLAKLDSFRDRIVEGPVKGVLEMGDTILDSLIAAIDILEPLKEIKDTLKNKIEFGADGDITQLKIYPYKPRPY